IHKLALVTDQNVTRPESPPSPEFRVQSLKQSESDIPLRGKIYFSLLSQSQLFSLLYFLHT
ncbi:hypothetical protein A2U01_0057381, partial [Trifolium medium]|nr:hypothetical protein [Trifolium medium]